MIMLNRESFLSQIGNKENTKDVVNVLKVLEPEPYATERLKDFEEQLVSNTKKWDICSVLSLYSKVLQPSSYLEIGVRRGKSMANVLRFSSHCKAYGFDMWITNYAGVSNPGPDFVRAEMKKLGYLGELVLIHGDSHITVPSFVRTNIEVKFDMVLVDGDHSYEGALKDLENVAPVIKLNGVLVFDDIYDVRTPWLLDAWKKFLEQHKEFVQIIESKDFTGTAVAVKIS
jgi:predicted O-methyltransferase YrrM